MTSATALGATQNSPVIWMTIPNVFNSDHGSLNHQPVPAS